MATPPTPPRSPSSILPLFRQSLRASLPLSPEDWALLLILLKDECCVWLCEKKYFLIDVFGPAQLLGEFGRGIGTAGPGPSGTASEGAPGARAPPPPPPRPRRPSRSPPPPDHAKGRGRGSLGLSSDPQLTILKQRIEATVGFQTIVTLRLRRMEKQGLHEGGQFSSDALFRGVHFSHLARCEVIETLL